MPLPFKAFKPRPAPPPSFEHFGFSPYGPGLYLGEDRPKTPAKAGWRWARWTLALPLMGSVAMAIGLWLLHRDLSTQAWIAQELDTNRVELLGTGWDLLWRTWPILVVGVLACGAVVWPLGIWVGARTAALDLAERRQEFEQKRADHETWCEICHLRIDARSAVLDEKLYALERREQSIRAGIAADEECARLEEREENANARVAAAEARAEEAERQREKAVVVTKSRRQQVEKLRRKLALRDEELEILREKTSRTTNGQEICTAMTELEEEGIERTPRTVVLRIARNKGIGTGEDLD